MITWADLPNQPDESALTAFWDTIEAANRLISDLQRRGLLVDVQVERTALDTPGQPTQRFLALAGTVMKPLYPPTL